MGHFLYAVSCQEKKSFPENSIYTQSSLQKLDSHLGRTRQAYMTVRSQYDLDL